METRNLTLIVISLVISAGIVLLFSLFIHAFRHFLKRRTKKRLLKEEVSMTLLRVETNENKRSNLWTRYKLSLFPLAYKPRLIDEDLSNLNFPVEKETIRLFDFFSLKPKGLWKLYTNFFFEPDRIPDRLLKPPKLTIKGLERKLEQLQELSGDQEKLIVKFEDKTDPKMPWKNEQGESIFISKIEWHSNMRAAGDLKGEKELEEAMLKAEIDGAKARLQRAIDYVSTRQSSKSLEAGEHPITRGTRHLDFEEVKRFGKEALEKVAALAEGVEQKSIVNFCNTASLDLEHNFEDWAKKILDRQFTFDEIRANLKELGENRKVEIIAAKGLINQITNLFQDTIPDNWSATNWELLQENIDEMDTALYEIYVLFEDLKYWAEQITEMEVRIQAVSAEEERLQEDYGITITPSGEWVKALTSWKNNVSNLLANSQQDELEKMLDSLETPLVQHSYKVRNRLDEAEKLTGVTEPSKNFPAGDESIAARLADIAHASQPPSNKSARRRPSRVKDEKKLTGTRVKVISPDSNLEIEVDNSIAEHYRTIKSTAPKEENNKHTK